MKSLSSNTTPIFKNGLCINLASKQDKLPPTKPTQSLPSVIYIMMGTGEVKDVNFLPAPSVEISPKLDKQLKTQLVSLLESDISLGYYSQSQKQCLEKNVGVVVGALCFFEKHWRKFLNADFPHVPNGKHSGYLLLECMSRCSRVRKKSSTEILTLGLLSNHIGKISALDWSPFKRASHLKVSLSLFKDEIEHIRGILYEKKQKMVTKNCLFNPQPQSSRNLSAFKSLANFAELDEENGEFFVPIPRSTTKQGDKKKRGKLTMKQTFIVKDIVDITNVLKFKEDYVPMFLDDENMGINDSAFAEVGGTITLDAGDRAYYRQEF